MKKIIFLLIGFSVFGITKAQNSDTLLRAAGFYISPALCNQNLTGSKTHSDPKFGGSLGFRFINKLSYGFFIEGGVGLGIFKGEDAEKIAIWYDYNYPYLGNYYSYTYRSSFSELNWMVPFLAGYKTQKGKVRFQGALGISFNLRNYEASTRIIKSGIAPQSSYYNHEDKKLSFGTSFFAIARAGISVPVSKKINVEILPTARYRMFYFTPDKMDLTKSIRSSERPWSLGLDVGIMVSLEDEEMEAKYETNANAGDAYTFKYNDDKTAKPLHKKLQNNGPKNAAYMELGGNGILYSLNYERTVFRKGIVNIQARGGFGFTLRKYCIPLGANIALGTTRKKFEAGLTITMNNFNRDTYGHINSDDIDFNAFNYSIDPSLAFRLESDAHFFLRLALMTHYFPVTGSIMPGVGISLGGCF
jgi:hypothetical protein